MNNITVKLGERSYPIFIDKGTIDNPLILTQYIKNKSVCVVTNTTVSAIYLDKIRKLLVDYNFIEVILDDGEEFKNHDSLNLIYETLLKNSFNRDATIIALGGGVVGDIAGFASASFMRGIDFIQIPTTLLSQVDSSVGGKTGINHKLGKNMIGAFYQPKAVLIDMNVLKTLPDREISAGLAEIIKYGLIWDINFFEFIEENIEALKNLDAEKLQYAIQKSCEIKSVIVAKDEKESNLRAILNLGHTFGHAIENCLGYGEWLHGEAVGCGIVMAAKMSLHHDWITKQDFQRIVNLLVKTGLPISMPEIELDKFLGAMRLDKKNKDNKIRLVLQKGIGKAEIVDDYSQDVLKAIISS